MHKVVFNFIIPPVIPVIENHLNLAKLKQVQIHTYNICVMHVKVFMAQLHYKWYVPRIEVSHRGGNASKDTSYLLRFGVSITIQGVYLFIYLGFYVAFNTVQVISRRVVGRAEETSTYSSLGFFTVNCRPTASNYQLSHLRPSRGSNLGLRGGRRECYHSATVAPTGGIIHGYRHWAKHPCPSTTV